MNYLHSNSSSRCLDRQIPFRILAIDGGGFRGLFAAKCLALWEETTGRRTADCFDLITGTSTGGIIALGLGLGLPAQQLVDFYLEDGKKIFPTSCLARTFRTSRRWLLPEFDGKALKRSLQRRLGEHSKLGDSRTRLVIPSYDLTVRKPYLFKTDHHSDFKLDWTRAAWEVAMATTAAPTYFPVYRSSWSSIFVDGGLWANNPSLIGAWEASHILGIPQQDIHILNLGTGVPSAGTGDLPWSRRLGIVGWAAGITDLVLDANALATSGVMDRMYRDNYVRVAPDLDNGRLPLDRYAPNQLLALAEDRARFWAVAAEAFFKYPVAPYEKTRARSVATARLEALL